MPFPRPSLTQLRQQIAADINAELGGVDALLRYSNLGILGDVLAATSFGHYGYLDWIALQQVPFTATGEFLEGWAALKGITRKPAAYASGTAVFPAADDAVIPVGTTINRSDGQAYQTTVDVAGANGSVTVPIVAASPGSSANAVAGAALQLGSGLSGVSASGAVATPISGGDDIEEDDSLRSRMLAAYAAPPQGGSISDYITWTLEVPGVSRAWVVPGAKGPGTLTVYFVMDVARIEQAGFPQGQDGCSSYEARDASATGDQLLVANALFPKQSVTALVYAVAPGANQVGLTIAGIADASPTTKAQIVNALAQALYATAAPGGLSDLSAIEAAIAAVPGTAGFVITNVSASAGTVDGAPTGNIRSATGMLPVPGAIGYV